MKNPNMTKSPLTKLSLNKKTFTCLDCGHTYCKQQASKKSNTIIVKYCKHCHR